jgi:hypothetical protein
MFEAEEWILNQSLRVTQTSDCAGLFRFDLTAVSKIAPQCRRAGKHEQITMWLAAVWSLCSIQAERGRGLLIIGSPHTYASGCSNLAVPGGGVKLRSRDVHMPSKLERNIS